MKWQKGCDSTDSIREIVVHSPRETVDSDEILLRCSDNEYQMSLGIHLSPKTIDISSATWPKMKRSDSNNGDVDVARIIRPQTATLERPRILDVTLIGKIDMSLTRKGLLSISNLCVAPLENLQTKINPNSNRENRHVGKTRKWHTPRRSMDDKERIKQMRNQCKRNGEKIYESWEVDENSVSDSTLSVKKVSKSISDSRSPSRGTPVKQGPRDKRVSPVNNINSNTNSPARRTLQLPRDKKLSPVNSIVSSPARGTKKVVPSEKRASPDNSSNSSNRNSSSNSNNSDENTDKPSRKSCKRPVIVKKDGKNVDEVFAGPKPGEVPEPCRTCGRPEQPERFHSHPPPSSHKQTSAMKRQQDNNNNNDDAARSSVIKSSVRKPVPIKYRSGKLNRRKSTSSETSVPSKVPSPDPLRRNSNTSVGVEEQPMERKSPRSGVFVILDEKPVVKPGPRTVLCYLCGREFGTASYPLHEPHCLQRWERENAKLPAHLQRSVPEKPCNPLTVEQWNAFAWEASQAHLVPCENCGRTFNPDRLEVHQRSCRPTGQPTRRANPQEQDSDGASTPVKVPPAVFCYICGKMFGTRSIGIHEPQCLEKWRLENEKLPPNQRRPEPMKPQSRVTSTSIATPKARQAPPPPQTDPELAAAPHTMDCYLCGREFDTRVLNQHEDECIKEWRKWNRSLPPEQRRPEPERPEFKFNKATGNMDFKATMDAIWQEHLKSLVPCSKGCGRTFNPDRVEIHERGCKGPKK